MSEVRDQSRVVDLSGLKAKAARYDKLLLNSDLETALEEFRKGYNNVANGLASLPPMQECLNAIVSLDESFGHVRRALERLQLVQNEQLAKDVAQGVIKPPGGGR